jgi:hypothetical protein
MTYDADESKKTFHTQIQKYNTNFMWEKEVPVFIKALCHEGAWGAGMTSCTVNLGTKQR